ncbi:MAG: hypothetical protein LBJ08_08350 [Bifidobacteriaceae bacterium]|nr:hypothetical protein [Bifidobacteriaceae bacterium]
MANRIFSEAYDSVTQRANLEGAFGGDTSAFVRFYRTRARIEALFLGKTILTDAEFYDGVLFHTMGEADRSGFLEFGRQTGALEVRCRESPIRDMFCKRFLFSSLDGRSPALSTAMYEIGGELSSLAETVRKAKGDVPITEYFEEVRKQAAGRLDSLDSEFGQFEATLRQLDEARTGDHAGMFVTWGTEPTEADPPELTFSGLPTVMRQKCCDLRDILRFQCLEGSTPECIITAEAELMKDFPNASTLYTLPVENPNYAEHFIPEFRRWYNIGIGSQHFANTVELQLFQGRAQVAVIGEDSTERARAIRGADPLPLAVSLDDLREVTEESWTEFQCRFETDGLSSLREELWGAIRSANKNDARSAISKISRKLGFSNPAGQYHQQIEEALRRAGESTETIGQQTYEFGQSNEFFDLVFLINR